MYRHIMALTTAAFAVTSPSASQDVRTAPVAATAVRTTRPPAIDGKADDVIWQTAPRVSQFRQFEPKADAVETGTDLEIPDLEGASYADAAAELEAMGLATEAESERDDDREPGEVIRTEPGAGTVVEEGDTIVIVVAVDQVEVPDVEGKKLDDAIEAIEDAGLTVGTVVGPEGGRVLTSWPFEGTEVETGSTVDLVLRPGR